MTNYYNEYDFNDAVKLVKDANLKIKDEEYAIAAYSAYVAKEVFERMDNPLGVDICKDIIDISLARIKGKVMDELLKEGEVITLSKLSKRISMSKDVRDLGELLAEEVKTSRFRLDEMGEIYKILVNGNSLDPAEYISFSAN